LRQSSRGGLVAALRRALGQRAASGLVAELRVLGKLEIDQRHDRTGLAQLGGLGGVVENAPRIVDGEVRIVGQ
jgi:hypothetical protein